MKTTANNQINCYLLSSKPAPLSFLSFQIVYQYLNDKKFIRSFNILADKKILKKIYLKEMIVSDDSTNIESFIIGELLKSLDVSSARSTNKTDKKEDKCKTDYDARKKAASNLFSVLGY